MVRCPIVRNGKIQLSHLNVPQCVHRRIRPHLLESFERVGRRSRCTLILVEIIDLLVLIFAAVKFIQLAKGSARNTLDSCN